MASNWEKLSQGVEIVILNGSHFDATQINKLVQFGFVLPHLKQLELTESLKIEQIVKILPSYTNIKEIIIKEHSVE